MALNEQKIAGNVTFLQDGDSRSLLDVNDAFLHLFQHEYDAKTLFWYGVVELPVSEEEFKTVLHIPHLSRRIRVSLPDGRFGAARMLNAEQRGQVYRLSFIGITQLAVD